VTREGTTMNDDGVPGYHAERRAGDVLALSICWCPDEPERVGEVFLFPARERGAVLGRGEAPLQGYDRVLPIRQRPGLEEAGSPFLMRRLSRHQLLIRAERAGRLEVRSVGRCQLLCDGIPVESVEVSPGEVLQVGSCLVLLCITRPWKMEPFEGGLHPFGEVDDLGMVGESAEAWALRTAIRTASAQDAHVLIEGPSGAGKELVAQGIHASSRRRRRPIVSRNAATFPETLIDAELFGNAANYPNPGMRPRAGLIGEADGSTLFLDEIGELSDALQAHLLRVLDNGEYQCLGESKSRKSDFRFIGATRRPTEVLRHDLLARLRVRIAVPGLNDRRDDIALLTRYLLREIAASEPGVADRFFEEGDWRGAPRISPALVRRLVQHDYTMNVRELETLLRFAIAGSPGNFLDVSARHLQSPDTGATVGTGPVDPGTLPPEVIQECLDRHGGKQSEVWRELGLSSRHVLARLIKKHGLRAGSE